MYDNLEAEQARKRMTNQQVSDVLGISRVSYEKKKKNGKFYVQEIVMLCKLFTCTFDYLFATEEPRPEKEMSTNAKAT